MPFKEFFETLEKINENTASITKKQIAYEKNKKSCIEANRKRYNNDINFHNKINTLTLIHNNKKYHTDPVYKAKQKEYYKQYNINKRIAKENANSLIVV